MRLWTLGFSFIYGAVGYFMYGWAAKAGESWALIAVGLGGMIAQQVSATSIATTYAMECFEGVRFRVMPYTRVVTILIINRFQESSSSY